MSLEIANLILEAALIEGITGHVGLYNATILMNIYYFMLV